MTTYLITAFFTIILAAVVDASMITEDPAEKISQKYNRYGVLSFAAILLILSLVAGLRWRMGADFNAYCDLFIKVKSGRYRMSVLREPGLAVIAWITGKLSDSPTVMFLTASVITILLYLLRIGRNTKDFLFSVLLFLFLGIWHGAFNGIRQYLAAAVLFYGHNSVKERKLMKWTLTVLIAMLFHRTSAALFPVYFIADKRISLKTLLIIALGVVVIRLSYGYLFSIMSALKGTEQTDYIYMNASVSTVRVCVNLAPLLLIVLNRKYDSFQNSETMFYSLMIIINAAFIVGTSGSAYLARVAIYTEPYAVLGIPRLMSCFNKKSAVLAKTIILLLFFAFWLVELKARNLVPYRSVFGA